MRFFDSILKASPTRPEIVEIRERMLSVLLPLVVLISAVPVALGSLEALELGKSIGAVAYVVGYSLLLLVALLRTRLPYWFRAGLLVSMGIGFGVESLFRQGLYGIGAEILLTFIVLGSVLFGIRIGLLLVSVGLLGGGLASLGFVTGFLEISREVLTASHSTVRWLNVGMVFGLFSFLLLLTPELLRRRLEQALALEESRTRDLTGANLALRGEIEARRQAEEASQESERRFRELADLLPETVFETDATARLTYVNAVGFSTFGYDEADLLAGVTALDMLAPRDHPRAMEEIGKALQGQSLGLREYLARRKDGTTFPVLVRSAPIAGEGTVGLRGIVIDISEKKAAESQILQAQKMEAVGNLAGGIAHDFNNLLMGIQGRVSLMLAHPEQSERIPGHLCTIEEHVESAASLTRQLLGLARGGKYETRITDLNDLIQKSLEMFQRTHKELTSEIALEARIWGAAVDRHQIEQVLLNLLLNAWQAMPGGGQLKVSTRNLMLEPARAATLDLEPGASVQISVGDTGTGIDPEVLPHIFEPFFTTKEQGRGTGLGLASTYGIVKNHGGAIEVETTPGEGTTFHVFLPARREESLEEEVETSEVLPTGEETILVVDDEQLILDSIAPLLQLQGYEVVCASSGQDALEVLESRDGEIDLVLLDLVMPRMSGSATYERIEQRENPPKVLLSSGYSQDGAAAALLDRGCQGFLQKPYKFEDLARKVRAVLDG